MTGTNSTLPDLFTERTITDMEIIGSDLVGGDETSISVTASDTEG